MDGDIIKGPEGFVTYARLFEKVDGGFKPLKLSEEERGILRMNLQRLEPGIFPYLGVTEDFVRTGRVREARRYDSGEVLVRFEVYTRRDDCSWDGPYQLLVLADEEFIPKAYTFINGSGRKARISGSLYKGHLKRPTSTFIEDSGEIMPAFMKMKDRDAVVVGNDECDGEFMIITDDGGEFMVSWQSCAAPWYFNSVKKVGRDTAAKAIEVYCEEGLIGVQKLLEWEVAESCDEASRKITVGITRELSRAKDRAIRDGDIILAKCLNDIGIVDDGEMEPFELTIDYDVKRPFAKMYGEISEYFERDRETWTKRDKFEICCLLIYVALYAPEEEEYKRYAAHNVWEIFNIGDAAEKNEIYEEYWRRRR